MGKVAFVGESGSGKSVLDNVTESIVMKNVLGQVDYQIIEHMVAFWREIIYDKK